MKPQLISIAWVAVALLSPSLRIHAQGTEFTYQGRLLESGAPFSGSAEIQATLWDAAEAVGAQVANIPPTVIVGVTNGLFTLRLNFGSAPFASGVERWLQLEVRTSIGAFSLLSPRQKLSGTPYSIVAGNVTGPVAASQLAGILPGANLGGTYPGAVIFNNAANSFSGNGASLSNINAATLNGIPSAGFWTTNGNAGANPTNGVFLGTRDNLPLEIKVNGDRALRLEYVYDPIWNSAAPNVVGGSRYNSVSNGVMGGFVGGGGNQFNRHEIRADYASIIGGMANIVAGKYATAGGFASRASGPDSVALGRFCVAAGSANVAIGSQALASNDWSIAIGQHVTSTGSGSIAMGSESTAAGLGAVAIGYSNTASGNYSTAMGKGTSASGEASTALGSGTSASALGATALGVATEASGERSTAAGFVTVASGFCATAFGRGNIAAGECSFAAGYGARANHQGSFVWADSAGDSFTSTAWDQFLIRASGGVGIGTPNPAGSLHVYSANNPTIMRVQSSGTPGFGRLEFVSNPQGDANEWRPAYIQSADAGGFTGGLSFVVNGTGAGNKFGEVETMRIVNGRVGIGTPAPASALQVVGTVTATAFNPPSDRNLKENFRAVDPQQVLAKVTALPISEWNFIGDTATPHVGPMAQDFHAAFGLGTDERHIATVDADGVALAAIQGLNEKVEAGRQRSEVRSRLLEEKLQQKETEITELKQSMNELRQLVEAMSHKLNGGAK